MGNSHFNQLPLRDNRVSICEYMNTSYRKYLMKSLKPPVSNFPYSDDPDEDLCDAYRADHEVC